MKNIPVLLLSVVAFVMLIQSIRSDMTAWRLRKGYDAYRRGDMDRAFSAWSSAGNQQEAVYNRAVIHARKGKGDMAAQLFIQSAAGNDPVIRQHSLYNHGTLLIQQGRVFLPTNQEKARDSFSSAGAQLNAALKHDPLDIDVQYNAAVARDLLAEVNALIASRRGEKKRPAEQRVPEKSETAKNGAEKGTQADKTGKAGAETGRGEGSGKSRSAPEMSKNDAERLLNDARGREILRSATVARTKPGAVSPPERDW